MSRFACVSFSAVLCLSSCSHRLSTALSWQGSYVGGSLVDDCDGVATDRAGNVYLACHVVSMDLPGLTDAIPTPEDPMNAYVIKLTAQLDAVEWGVLLAGSQYDGAFDIAVDARGHVFVAGLTGSADFPVTANALQKIYGGGEADAFFMKFQFVNPTAGPATVQLSFFDGAGDPMSIPYTQDGSSLTSATLTDTIAPGGVEFAVTGSSGAVQIGYAVVQSTPENAVAVSAAFNQIVPGRPLFQSFIPLDTVLHDRFFVPYLNTGGFTGSMAIVSLVMQDVAVIARNNNGVELCRDTETVAAGSHRAFLIRDRLPCTLGNDGVVEVLGTAVGLAGFGLTAQDDGAFVTQPVYGPRPI